MYVKFLILYTIYHIWSMYMLYVNVEWFLGNVVIDFYCILNVHTWRRHDEMALTRVFCTNLYIILHTYVNNIIYSHKHFATRSCENRLEDGHGPPRSCVLWLNKNPWQHSRICGLAVKKWFLFFLNSHNNLRRFPK